MESWITDNKIPLGRWISDFVDLLNDEADWVFQLISDGLGFLIEGLIDVMAWFPPLALIAVFALIAWFLQRSWKLVLLLVALLLLVHQPSQLAELMGGVAKPIEDTRTKIYAAAVNEMLRCLAEPAAIPARDGEVKVILDAIEAPQRTCVAYFFGRLCELRNKPDDAKWWYRTAMETQDWTSVCRPQAAAGLRRLGEAYYK